MRAKNLDQMAEEIQWINSDVVKNFYFQRYYEIAQKMKRFPVVLNGMATRLDKIEETSQKLSNALIRSIRGDFHKYNNPLVQRWTKGFYTK